MTLTFTVTVTLKFTGIALKGAEDKDRQMGDTALSADVLTLAVPVAGME